MLSVLLKCFLPVQVKILNVREMLETIVFWWTNGNAPKVHKVLIHIDVRITLPDKLCCQFKKRERPPIVTMMLH